MDRVKQFDIAAVCHEANRALCQAFGDPSQVPWDETPDDIKQSARAGVAFLQANPDAGADALHRNWMKDKAAAGWKHGAVKDAEAKTHPCLVPFAKLPAEQKAKDHVFLAIVRAMTPRRRRRWRAT